MKSDTEQVIARTLRHPVTGIAWREPHPEEPAGVAVHHDVLLAVGGVR
jgi:hypothetical protein